MRILQRNLTYSTDTHYRHTHRHTLQTHTLKTHTLQTHTLKTHALQTHTTDTFLSISHTTNVLLFKLRCNIFIGVRIIKEMPSSVASAALCIKCFTRKLLLPSGAKNVAALEMTTCTPRRNATSSVLAMFF